MPEDPPPPLLPPPPPAQSQAGEAAASTEAWDVFLSYHSTDRAVVEAIAVGLSDLGLKPFLDRWDLAPGLRWRPELERALASCRATAILLGPGEIGEVQSREIGVALHRQDKDPRFPVVPVLLPGATPPEGFLEALTWIDLRHQPLPEGIADLARAIRGRWSAQEIRQKNHASRQRYAVNFVLLLLALGTAGLWYFRHVHSRLAPTAVGGSVLFLIVLRLAYEVVKWGTEEEIKNLPKRLLGYPLATPVLSATVVAGLVALLVTSSLHLGRDATHPEDPAPTVEVRTAAGEVLWTSPPLTTARPIASRRFFGHFGTDARLQLLPEGDREPVSLRIGPATRAEIRVPTQFAPREVTVVRVLPGILLSHVLGLPGSTVNRRFDLRVSAGGRTNTVTDLRRQALYLGRLDRDITLGLQREPEDQRHERLGDWARVHGATAAARSRDLLREAWEANPRPQPWSALPDAGALQFDLLPDGAQSGERLVSTVLDGTNQIRTVVIERKP